MTLLQGVCPSYTNGKAATPHHEDITHHPTDKSAKDATWHALLLQHYTEHTTLPSYQQ
jgi:hypothetical protein